MAIIVFETGVTLNVGTKGLESVLKSIKEKQPTAQTYRGDGV